MTPDRSTITAASGRAVIVERRAIGARLHASDANHAPLRSPSLAELILDIAGRVRRLAPPSRTRPHLFAEHKDKLAAELRRLAGAAR